MTSKEMDLRTTCGRASCKAPVAWTPYRVKDEAVGFAATCDKCGNNMFKGEIINEEFARDVRALFQSMKGSP